MYPSVMSQNPLARYNRYSPSAAMYGVESAVPLAEQVARSRNLSTQFDQLAPTARTVSGPTIDVSGPTVADPYDDFWDNYEAPKNAGTIHNVADAADDVANVADDVAAAGKGGLGKITSGLGTAWNNVKSGKGIAPQYAKYANIAAGIGALNAAANGYSEYSNAVSDTEDLVSNILASAGGNPNLRYDLSSDQLQLLRRLQNGTYDTSAGFSIDGLMNNLGDVASGAGMGFLTGGWTGAALGALSPIASGITSGMTADQGRITAELEGLYNALRDSEMTTKDMKRNANMQRYANSIYGY